MPKIIYISGPYSGETEEEIQANIAAAEKVAREMAEKGFFFICPHLNSAGMHTMDVPIEFWYKMDFEILSRCDAIYMMKHWNKSRGARDELVYAYSKGIEIFFEGDNDYAG